MEIDIKKDDFLRKSNSKRNEHLVKDEGRVFRLGFKANIWVCSCAEGTGLAEEQRFSLQKCEASSLRWQVGPEA